ncbi:MAG: anti-sigma factor [Actinobacteria bacterium]|nr:MAG: anti-sigma factor [Actinomycetota bacterium]TML47369.1 MAG: anti-sigma factor [Actinomycetota bacterium]TML69580.1 MAG: anti-sigma factor [Actinomycetota bacterium]
MEPGIHKLTAGYALDALDAEERRTYEAHLPDCERCREELASFWSVTEALAVASSGPTPSADLRGRILTAVRAEPQVVIPFEPPRRRRVVPALAAAAAVAAAVAIGLGIWAAHLSSDLDGTRSALSQTKEAARVLADPEARTVALKTGTGRLVVAPDGRAALAVSGLDPAPAGKTYEVWVLAGKNAPVPSGLFRGREGADLVGLAQMVGTGDVVAVTIERAGGVNTPTTAPIVQSRPA